MLHVYLALFALRLLAKDGSVCAGVESHLIAGNLAGGSVIEVGDLSSFAENTGSVDGDIRIGSSKQGNNDFIVDITLLIGSRKGQTCGAVVIGNGGMCTCTDSQMVITELANLLPVSKGCLIHAVPVHEFSGLMTCTQILHRLGVFIIRSACFIAVIDLDSAGTHQQEGTGKNSVTGNKNGIVGCKICQNIVGRIRIECFCVFGITTVYGTCGRNVGSACCRSKLKVNHGVESAGCPVIVFAKTMTEVLTGHPEAICPVGTGSCGVVLSPLIKSCHALILQCFPCGNLNVLCSIAAEAVNAELADPLCKPGRNIAGYGVVAILCLFG